MDAISFVLYFAVFVAVVVFAIWIVRQTIPAGQPQMIALAVVGVIALLVLFGFYTGRIPLLRLR